MEKFTRYKKSDLANAISEVRQFLVDINPKFISTLKYKFQKPEYMKVGSYEFKFWVVSESNTTCWKNMFLY